MLGTWSNEILMILDYVTLASLGLGKLDAYETNIYIGFSNTGPNNERGD